MAWIAKSVPIDGAGSAHKVGVAAVTTDAAPAASEFAREPADFSRISRPMQRAVQESIM